MMSFQTVQLFSKGAGKKVLTVFLNLLLCGLVVFSSFGYADDDDDDEVFCFTDLDGDVCSSNISLKYDFLEVGEIEKGSDPITIRFKFRAYDESDSEKWDLKRGLLRYSFLFPQDISEDSYNIEMISPTQTDSWSEGDSGKISGGDDEGSSDIYYTVELKLTFIDNYFNNLEAGEHFFWLPIHGRVSNENYKTFYIGITIDISTKVKISGLDNFPFGTFLADDFSRSETKTFCAHVQGGGNFKITPTTESTRSFFALKGTSTGSTIPYTVSVANVGQNPVSIDYGETRAGLVGESSENCTTGENMQLKIELPEISALSVKPADSYMDTLILTIEPD
ncbi:hypothetical protein GZ77_18885 [Endozoicomonas montiporae]|uniref:Uncharacterized protein n=2 Tax=Endozoicomonas montiporae TaxID=1027273 RepID=A0A081N2A2_9GAMM|nr:hypothetical protein [Endozoicomonas montiporae]AMO58465.1 hypothetical protein EZMO1_4553 [Endozoicomonas montiporae CL-33]KEQ12575.1 hypothetical protein GZ77_18885 [Endozoicomonas montiporae]